MIELDSDFRSVMQLCEPVARVADLFEGVGLECPGVEALYQWFDATAGGDTISDFIEAAENSPNPLGFWIIYNALINEEFRVLLSAEVQAEYLRVAVTDNESRGKLAATFTGGLPSEFADAIGANFPEEMLAAWRTDPAIIGITREF